MATNLQKCRSLSPSLASRIADALGLKQASTRKGIIVTVPVHVLLDVADGEKAKRRRQETVPCHPRI